MKEILKGARGTVNSIGVDILGLSGSEVATHSVRVSLVMIMYLANDPLYTITLIGQWSSDAFGTYIENKSRNPHNDSAP